MAQKTAATAKSVAASVPTSVKQIAPGYGPSVNCSVVLDYLRTNGTKPPGNPGTGNPGLSAWSAVSDIGGYFGTTWDWTGRKASGAETYEFTGDVRWATNYMGTKPLTRTIKVMVGKWAQGQMAVLIADKDKSGATTTYVDSAASAITCGQNQGSVWLSGVVYNNANSAAGWLPYIIHFAVNANQIN